MRRRADRQAFFPNEQVVGCGTNNGAGQLGLIDRRGQKAIDFHAFKVEYWGCLTGTVSGCSPELLFAEIMGIIKGSGVTAKTLEYLSREQYISRSCKISPAFVTEGEREKAYSAFERYEKLKKQRGEFDEIDRVIEILRLLEKNAELGNLVHQCFEEIYVDGLYSHCWMDPLS